MESSGSPLIVNEINEIVQEAQGTLALLLPETAAIVLLIWDTIITFDQEVELIWRAPTSIVKFLFLFIRYTALSTIIVESAATLGVFTSTINICLISSRWVDVASTLLLWSVDLLLLYRVFAFYGRNIKLLYSLLALWVLNIAAITVFAILIYLKYPVVHVTTGLLPGVLPECIVTSFPRFLSDIWICELIFQSILFFLVMYRFIRLQITSWKDIQGISGVYLIFIRDGVWAYVVLFVTFFGSATEHRLSGLTWIIWDVPLVAVTATRLILNLKDAGAPGSSWSSPDSSSPLPRWMQRMPIVFNTIGESTYTEDGSSVSEDAAGNGHDSPVEIED